jgi:hypothetical protein
LTVESDASASVSIALALDDLVRHADAVAIVTPVEENSVWENGRIFTYTRVHVDTGVAGELGTGGETWIRTLGGIVGHIGQSVEGEAVFTMGRPSMLFLHHGSGTVGGTYEVAGRAQGQFPVYLDEAKQLRVMRSSAVGVLLPPRQTGGAGAGALPADKLNPLLARDALHQKPVDEATRMIAEAYKRLHAAK